MNAKLILAAVAAICCVQGIAAAVRPMPLFEKDVKEIDLSDLDLDDVVEQLSLAVQQAAHDDEVYAVEVEGDKRLKAPRNILTCIASIGGLVKTGKSVWDLFEEYETAKKTLKVAEEACEKLPALTAFFGDDDTKESCNKNAEAAYEKEFKKVQSQIIPVVMKFAHDVKKAFQSFKELFDIQWEWFKRDVKCAICESDPEKVKDCKETSRKDAVKAWDDKTMTPKLWDATTDMLIGPINLYTSCTNLLA